MMRRRRGKTPSPVRRQVGVVVSLAILGIVCVSGSYQLGLVVEQSWINIVPGWALVAAGVILRVLAAIEIGSTQQIEALVTSGIYSRTRNPIYLALMLIVVGAALVSGAILAIGWVMISGATLYWLAKREERDLDKMFGEAYLKYKQDVPIFWPRLGR
jgi:protein-S-isoprenylcysteine O-methyltransferase Ste14